MPEIYLDPETCVVQQHFAVVYTPRRQRQRFPENCVQLYPNEQEMRAGVDADKHRYPARVLGPSRSSEGLRLYYLVEWLD